MNLEDEIICGFQVSAQKKRANAVYLDLIREFGRLCDQNHITWWLAFGTLIGAVRHKGFIPWDDDVDIIVPRKDFDRLLRISNDGFGASAPYFLQTPHTDPAFQQRILRFRRSDTSYITRYDIEMAEKAGRPYDMGLALAIFPLDNVPKSEWFRRLQVRIARAGVAFRTEDGQEGLPKKTGLIRSLVFRAADAVLSEKMIVRGIHAMYRICRKNRSGFVQSFEGFYQETCLWPAACFAGTVQLPFEDITVPAPVDYDSVLRVTYGDYMEFPPPEQRVENHADYMSADIAWPEALQMVKTGEISVR